MNTRGYQPIGEVRVIRHNPEGHVVCPHCGCKTTSEIEVKLAVPEFESGKGFGRYTGCAGCGWQGPMDITEGKYGEIEEA